MMSTHRASSVQVSCAGVSFGVIPPLLRVVRPEAFDCPGIDSEAHVQIVEAMADPGPSKYVHKHFDCFS
jgi:hypothetical protein